MKTNKPLPAFPMETVFGADLMQRQRPDLVEREAEDFLAYGGKDFHGFDVHDPVTRRALIERPVKDFIDFEPLLPPELAARLAALPAKGALAQADALAAEIAAFCKLPEHLTVWIDRQTAVVTPR